MLNLSRRSRTCLFVEQLESRRLLAGNCGASFDGEVLNVSCDEQANHIEVFGNEAGDLVLRGRANTTINGESEVNFGSADALARIGIDMAGGDDVVTVRDLAVSGSVEVATGNGDDTVNVRNLEIGQGLTIDTGNGRDVVNMTSAATQTSDVPRFSVRENLTIRTGQLADEIFVSGLEVNRISILAGGGNDTVELRRLSATTVIDVATENGDDRVTVQNLKSGGNIVLDGGNGRNDVLRYNGQLAAEGRIITSNFEQGDDGSDDDPPGIIDVILNAIICAIADTFQMVADSVAHIPVVNGIFLGIANALAALCREF